MIKPILILLAAASLTALSVDAKTVKIPNEDFAIASVTFPDDWEQEEVTNGVGATSPDEAVYLAITAVGSKKGMDAELEDTFAMLKEHDVELDEASKKENKFKVNGLDAEELLFQGKDKDGPTVVSITFVPVKDKVVVVTYWVSTADEKKNQAAVGKIINSLKPL
jgi:hypothetical protein